MKKILSHRLIKYFASIRFAIPVIFAFAACMIAGTILESKYGTQYAGRKVYFTWWFFAVLGGIVISVSLSLLQRLPIKRRLIGFYIVHISIVIIVIGAVITRNTGLDGTISLAPGQANANVLHGDEFIYFYKGSTELKLKLPLTADPTRLDAEVGRFGDYSIRAVRYLPYAREIMEWKKGGNAWVSRWLIKNAQFTERVEVADQPMLDIQPSAEMGPLSIKVVTPSMVSQLEAATKSRAKPVMIRDRQTSEVYVVRKFPSKIALKDGGTIGVSEKKMHSGNLVFYSIDTPTGAFRFFPKFSTLPVNTALTEQSDARFELIDLKIFAERPTVLMAKGNDGRVRLAYGKGGEWGFAKYGDSPVSLPWMGIQLTLMSETVGEVPSFEYDEAVPDKDDAKNIRAALVEITGPFGTERGWVSNHHEYNFNDSQVELRGWINPEVGKLPWNLTLENFKMDLVPGTQDPASYESFVKVASTGEQAHIFMNNPLKKDGYTIYQSSYFQDEQGRYNTVLSVNRDPGRPVKYVGSLMLVFGMILHFAMAHGVIRFEALDAWLERRRAAMGEVWKFGGEKA